MDIFQEARSGDEA